MALVTAAATVRLQAGNPTTTEISDNLITDALARSNDNIRLAAAEILETRAAIYQVQAVSKSIGGTFNYNASKMAEGFLAIARQLRESEALLGTGSEFASIEVNPGGVIEDAIVENELHRMMAE